MSDKTGTPPPCRHPKDRLSPWHDNAVICNQCNCITEQDGRKIEPAVPLFSEPAYDRKSPSISSLMWHRGPANNGEGTAGGNMWIDGEDLLVIIELSDGDREVLSVIINADGDQASMVMNGSGEDTGWDLCDIYWWARVSDLNLPPKEGRKE